MDLNSFDDNSLQIISAALLIAKEHDWPRANTTALLLACQQNSTPVKNFLRKHKILPQRIAGRHVKRVTPTDEPIALTDELLQVLTLARVLADGGAVTPLHLFCAILADEPECLASRELRRCGLRQPRPELLRLFVQSYPSLRLV